MIHLQKLEDLLAGKPDKFLTVTLLVISIIVVLIAFKAPRLVKLAAIPYLLLP